MADVLTAWNGLSTEGLVGQLVDFFGNLGDWAGAASNLIGLI